MIGCSLLKVKTAFGDSALGTGYCWENPGGLGRRMNTCSVATAPAMVLAKRSNKSCKVATDFRIAAAWFMVERKSSLRVPTKSRSASDCEMPRAGAIANAITIAAKTWAKGVLPPARKGVKTVETSHHTNP